IVGCAEVDRAGAADDGLDVGDPSDPADPSDPSDPGPLAPADADCLAALGDVPRAELWTRAGARLDGVDAPEVGFDWAPQGGLYTPYLLRVWGQPDLFQPSEYEGLGRVWARWSVVDPADGYGLAVREGSNLLECVVEDDGEAFLAFAFDVEYFGEDYGGMTIDALEARQVDLSIALGRHPTPGPGVTQWGHATYTDAPVTFTVDLTVTEVLSSAVPVL
ncbi:MAG: hypothetical protein ABMB14_37350, partial [Myxococcota bacterium]